jgi:hypothetical protein
MSQSHKTEKHITPIKHIVLLEPNHHQGIYSYPSYEIEAQNLSLQDALKKYFPDAKVSIVQAQQDGLTETVDESHANAKAVDAALKDPIAKKNETVLVGFSVNANHAPLWTANDTGFATVICTGGFSGGKKSLGQRLAGGENAIVVGSTSHPNIDDLAIAIQQTHEKVNAVPHTAVGNGATSGTIKPSLEQKIDGRF